MTGHPAREARPFVAISTKAYFGAAHTRAWIRGVVTMAEMASRRGIEVVVFPSFPLLESAAHLLEGSGICLGAQSVAATDDGAHTGEVTASLLAEIGCRYVEVGHSERRRDHGETPVVVREKVAQALRHGLIPLLCVGEDEPGPREAAADRVVESVAETMSGLDSAPVVVAYEPVWAIGAAHGAPAGHVAHVADALRATLNGRAGPWRIVYGGAAGPGTATALGGCVDGLFLGRFAHDLHSLDAIVREIGRCWTHHPRCSPPRQARRSGRTAGPPQGK
ncbi:MAG: triose-phosphate isomerase [Bifidobacteriaceae bacterium]|jgi:triosephosphate isomerase|nr:triose-phosphate isomerase [Bifidobacteriaceae bacterium]